MSDETFLFTSESVNEGHPDKLADQVSDAVLDACLAQDPNAKVGEGKREGWGAGGARGAQTPPPPPPPPRPQVACETATKTNMIMVFGEITTTAKVDYEAVVRKTARDIGFTSDDVGLNADTCKVLVHLEEQSPDIGQGVHGLGTKAMEDIGAGDQVGRWAAGRRARARGRLARRHHPTHPAHAPRRATCLATRPTRPRNSCRSRTSSRRSSATASPSCARTAPCPGCARTARRRSRWSTARRAGPWCRCACTRFSFRRSTRRT